MAGDRGFAETEVIPKAKVDLGPTSVTTPQSPPHMRRGSAKRWGGENTTVEHYLITKMKEPRSPRNPKVEEIVAVPIDIGYSRGFPETEIAPKVQADLGYK